MSKSRQTRRRSGGRTRHRRTRIGGNRKSINKLFRITSCKKRPTRTKKGLYKRKQRGGGDEITITLDDSELRDMAGTQEFFVDPVIASDGQTYERSTIQKWMSQHNTSPFTREVLTSTQLYPNIVIQKITRAYVEKLDPTNADKIAWNERLAQVRAAQADAAKKARSDAEESGGPRNFGEPWLPPYATRDAATRREVARASQRAPRDSFAVRERDAPINWQAMEERIRQMTARERGQVDPADESGDGEAEHTAAAAEVARLQAEEFDQDEDEVAAREERLGAHRRRPLGWLRGVDQEYAYERTG